MKIFRHFFVGQLPDGFKSAIFRPQNMRGGHFSSENGRKRTQRGGHKYILDAKADDARAFSRAEIISRAKNKMAAARMEQALRRGKISADKIISPRKHRSRRAFTPPRRDVVSRRGEGIGEGRRTGWPGHAPGLCVRSRPRAFRERGHGRHGEKKGRRPSRGCRQIRTRKRRLRCRSRLGRLDQPMLRTAGWP